MPTNGLPGHSVTPTPNPTNGPPVSGRLALQREIDDLWHAMNQPRTTARQMTALYARAAELRAELETLNLENQNHD